MVRAVRGANHIVFQFLCTHHSRTHAHGHANSKRAEINCTFCAELRSLAEHCNFEDAALENMLRDRLVCGIADRAMQQRLLSEPNLTFKKAYDLAVLMESVRKDTTQLQSKQGAEVHFVQKSTPRGPPPKLNPCYRCGGRHKSSVCKFKEENCHFCGKKGHISRVCRSRQRQQHPAKSRPSGANPEHDAKHVDVKGADASTVPSGSTEQPTDSSVVEDPVYWTFQLSKQGTDPLLVTLSADQADLQMEIDTGASVSVISEDTYLSVWPGDQRPVLQKSTAQLRTYSGELMHVCGTITVCVFYRQQQKTLPLLVVRGAGRPLFGRDWMKEIKLDWKLLQSLHSVNKVDDQLQSLLENHAEVFRDELGSLRDIKVTLQISPDAQPCYHRPRPIPYALRSRVEDELTRLEEDGVIEPVAHSDWDAPIVPVVKRDGAIRDFKVTVNKVAKRDMYPLPKVEDLLSTLAGGKSFSKLDLSHAYQQLHLSEESKPLVTINTSKGLYQYTRLPFGVSAAPSIFQRTMENLLKGIPNVVAYIDDILVTGKTDAEYLKNLQQVLQRLQESGMRLKRSKCSFMLPKVTYLGYVISSEGVHPAPEKVRAIRNAPIPTNLSQLKSFLGLLNFYSRFLPNQSTLLAPLHRLLRKNTRWEWGSEQQTAFEAAKSSLSSSSVLIHFNPDLPLIVSADASSYGVGAVLTHQLKDGTEQPVAFSSRTLSPAEKNYAQIDKEGLAIIFAVTKFRQYLLGRSFELKTDHKPLTELFAPDRAISQMSSARIQRWNLILSSFDYTIQYKKGCENVEADTLSRLPLPESPIDVPLPGETVLLLQCLQQSPITATQIKLWTDKDPLLLQVRNFVSNGWPYSVSEEIQPYFRRRSELTLLDGCLMWGSRVIIPAAGHSATLDELHIAHPGISRMKGLARSYLWWPGVDTDLEKKVKSCSECQLHQNAPAKAPLHPWEWPERPWARLHIDFAGLCFGDKTFLVIVDAHSKWLEIIESRQTAESTIRHLQTLFSTHGLPEIIVSDNGPAFRSEEFKDYLSSNGIRHIQSAPYHPASNGLAERAVQSFKRAMKKATGSLAVQLNEFLFRYRITPHTTTGRTPAELLMGRRLRSRLSLLLPNAASKVHKAQEAQRKTHDHHTKLRTFSISDPVFVRNFNNKTPLWLSGHIKEKTGPLSYKVSLDDGRIIRRHVDHIRHRTATREPAGVDNQFDLIPSQPCPTIVPPASSSPQPVQRSTLRRSNRNRRPPDRYSPSKEGRNM